MSSGRTCSLPSDFSHKADNNMSVLFARYEMRRQCQEIHPHLFLGPLQASKSLDTLKSLGITHMYVQPPMWLHATVY